MVKIYKFKTRTGEIQIDYDECVNCNSYDCAKVCSLYGRGIIKIKKGFPVILSNKHNVVKIDNECLACEIYCPYNAVKIILPFPELDKYLKGEDHVNLDR